MKIVFFIVITIIIFFSWFFLNTKSSSNSLESAESAYISEDEISSKIIDLTSLSSRISKKNIYLDLKGINSKEYPSLVKNLLAYKQVTNFEESFIDIIPGDILNINLFGNNFQKEIKTVEKSSSNKVIRTKSLDNENESFLVIGNKLAFGKFHFNGKVFLLSRNENLTYIVDTSEADLEIPQFSEEDYSLEKK
jgi:predicted HTH transcriptional regulator